MSGKTDKVNADLAKAIAWYCVRNNTILEDIHSGKSVISKTGD
jgi:hypothetical protein